jgi:5-methylcytosine-specific restriction endonuclease McrBC regulatory subunit McrC
VINLGKKEKLEIQTGYSDQLFKRMLLRCCGVFADTNTSDNSAESDQSIYSLIAQYLYLISLRKVMGRIIPKRYEYLKDRGYNIRGNVDINEYINKDLILADKKISHIYPERVEIMNILIVLYAALKRCKKISGSNKILPKLSQFEGYLRETCCGKRPTRIMINNIHKEKCLKNNLYTDFNRPLDFAKIILKNDDTAPGDDTAKSGISGFLIDTSFLWEMYLYNVMRTKLSGWDVSDQTDIKMYEGMFYEKTNHPDFIVESTEQDSIFILDAKFKTMQFRKKDVDNKDIQQVHSYSYYYHLKEGDRFKGTALIYPYKKEFQTEKDKECKVSNMFGLPVENVKERFTILALQDNPDDLDQSENEFINDLMAFIENKTNETVDNQSGPK